MSQSSAKMCPIFLVFCFSLFYNFNCGFAHKCERVNTTILPSCVGVGYNFTAHFSDVGQQTYQVYVSSEVTLFVDRFKKCSLYSQLFVCSRYVPKCEESAEDPILPCQEVCRQFVEDCEGSLKESGLHGLYLAYCGLLSSEQQNSTNCLKPTGFVRKVNQTKEARLPSCERVVEPACLNNNFSVLENATRTRLQSSLNSLAPVLNSSCSPNLEKFSCFIQTAPCVTGNGSTLFTCQSLCEEVGRMCDDEFQTHNIFFPKCMPSYPENIAGNGLCQLSQWPVPWPSPSHATDSNKDLKRLKCHCDDCVNASICITDGSCFMQHSTDANGTESFIRSCLDQGLQRDFICDPSLPNKQDVLCCEQDFCNGNASIPTFPPNSVTRQSGESTVKGTEKTNTKTPQDLAVENDTDKPSANGANQVQDKSVSDGVIAAAVVASVSLGILLSALVMYVVHKKCRKNAKTGTPNPNFIDTSNISACGTCVTIGEKNQAFEEDIFKNESALY